MIKGMRFGMGNVDTRFKQGHSGRPKGTLNKRTQLFKECVQDDLPEILMKIVQQAKDGCKDSQALLFKRYAPSGSLTKLIEYEDLTPFNTTTISARLIYSMLDGEITTEECGRALQSIAAFEVVLQAKDDRAKLEKLLAVKNEQCRAPIDR